MTEGVKTVAFRSLPIAPAPVRQATTQQVAVITPAPSAAAKLIIQPEPASKNPPQRAEAATPAVSREVATHTPAEDIVPKTSLASLRSIRNQITQRNKEGDTEIKPLTEEELHTCWGLFIEKLRSKSNHSAVTNFRAAELKVTDPCMVGIITQGEIHKAFIEEERADLVTHLQDYFNNRQLVYQVTVIEKGRKEEPGEVALTRKQQYLKIIEEYPIIKELKDRLKLELE